MVGRRCRAGPCAVTGRSMPSIRFLQRHEHAKAGVLRLGGLQHIPVTPDVPAQVCYHIAEEDHMASPISMPRWQRPEGDKPDGVSMPGAGKTVTEKLSNHDVDVSVAAAPETSEGGGEHVVLGGRGIEFGAALLHLADDHVGHVRRNAESV